jgi:zinc transport system substrate-binding protein
MKIYAVAAIGAAFSLSATLSGCSAFDDSATSADGVVVATAFYPLQYVAERVAGGHATVENLTAPGGEPHDLELNPQETAEVVRADLIVYLPGFQPSVDQAVETNATGDVLDVADTVDVRDDNPHFWQDPLLMADLGDEVADRLTEIDPAHADDYHANAAALRTDLEALDAAYESGLTDCERTTVVVSHDAFGYLDRYGLEFEPIEGLSPGAEPTPADLARLQELIRDEGITTVFSETLVSPEAAEQLAQDTGVKSAVHDPIEGLTDQTQNDDYLSLMKANLAALEEANGC